MASEHHVLVHTSSYTVQYHRQMPEKERNKLQPSASTSPGSPHTHLTAPPSILCTKHHYPYFINEERALKRLSKLFRAYLVMGIWETQTHAFSSMLWGYHIISTTMNALRSSLTIANHSYFHFLTLIVQQGEAHTGAMLPNLQRKGL